MPVYAISDGKVTFASIVPNSTWGKLVVIQHPSGHYSRYGHLRTMSVTTGDIVSRGDEIGTIGGSEYNVPDHLHMDISHTGILGSWPTYWPGDNLDAVLDNFIDPKEFLQNS